MIIAGRYSFCRGVDEIETRCPDLLREIEAIIAEVDSAKHFTKVSEEKTKLGKLLYSPESLNGDFTRGFKARGWQPKRVVCTYSDRYYVGGYTPSPVTKRPRSPAESRTMDFLKGKLGVEVQFGKYSFMVYNVCAKMTIFHNLGFIDLGVEIVPVKDFAEHMSSGVSYFEQMVWDLEQRGCGDIDIPVIILGLNAEGPHPDQPAKQKGGRPKHAELSGKTRPGPKPKPR